MVVVGADVYNRTLTFVAVNEAGRKLGEKTVTAITAGHAEAVMWAGQGNSTPKRYAASSAAWSASSSATCTPTTTNCQAPCQMAAA